MSQKVLIDAMYFMEGVEVQRSTSSRMSKVGLALIGGSCLVLLSVMTISASGPTSAAESTSLIGLPTSLRSSMATSPIRMLPQTTAALPGPSPWKELALAAVEDHSRCDRDVSVNAGSRVNAVLASMEKAEEEEVIQTAITTVQELNAGRTAPMGIWDPIGFSTKVGGAKLAYYREAEIKHGRICMLASVGYLFGELFHPFFGGELTGQSFKYALPEGYTPVGMGTFWLLLFATIGLVEGRTSAGTLKGMGEMADTKRVPGDFGFDPLNLKYSGYTGTSLLDMQNKELNNGRLAMLAYAGMVGQELATGKTLFPGLISPS